MKAYTANIPRRLAALLLCAALLLPAFGSTALAARAEEANPGQSYTQPEGDVSTPATAAGEESESTASAGANDAAAEGVQDADEAAEPAAPAPETETPAPATVPAAAGVAACTNAVAAYALDGAARAEEPVTVTISNLRGPQEVYEQGDAPSDVQEKTNVQFQFKLTGHKLGGFEAGDTVAVDTNIGKLFTADWANGLAGLRVEDADGNLLATVSVTADTVTFTIAEGGAGYTTLQGILALPTLLVPNTVGAAQDKPVKETLTVGGSAWDILFKVKPQPGGSTGPGLPDVDRFWKNYWSITNLGAPTNGASAQIEINPIGSIDLYGSTTYPETIDGQPNPNYPRNPVTYTNFLVWDEVPEHAHIDLDSLQICASIPEIKQYTGETTWVDQYHGDETHWGYDLPAGTYYAQRADTKRRYDIRGRMTQLTQNADETWDQFKARVQSAQLQWGVYVETDDQGNDTETLFCNFGNIGGENNNGILYSDYQPEKVEQYPEIFGPEGASNGAVVSYYITFNTYAPNAGAAHTVTNPGHWEAQDAAREGHSDRKPYTSGGNDSSCLIADDGGFASAAVNDLVLRLVDEDFRTSPIEGAKFSLYEWNESEQTWEPAGDGYTDCTTDANGFLTFKGLVEGKYKLMQTSTPEGYRLDTAFYAAAAQGQSQFVQVGDADGYFTTHTNGSGQSQSEYAELTVPEGNTKGYITLVTNSREQHGLILRLVDEDYPTVPIAGATFELWELNGQGEKEENIGAKTTSATGYLTFDTLEPGDYQLVQTSSATGYTFKNDTYGPYSGEYTRVGQTGVFTMPENAAQDVGTLVTNARRTSFTVQKVWDDDENRDNLRPESVTVQLLQNGQEVRGETLTLTQEEDWRGTFADLLPYDENGRPFVYAVQEEPVPDYTAAVTGSAAAGFTITNTHEPETTEVTVTKVWDDDGDRDGVRPPAVVIELLANGAVADTCYLTNSTATGTDTWTHTFTGLPKYENGKEITYDVREQTVEDYTAKITGDAKNGFTVTNTHKPEMVALTFTKVWDDGGNRDGLRPQSVEIQLLAGGNRVDTVVLADKNASADDANVWTRTVEYPVYEAGKKLTYTVAESTVPGYEEPVITGDAKNGFTVTNRHVPAPESTPGNTPSGTTPTPTPAPAPQPEPASAPQAAAVIPQTGDDAPVGLWAALAIAAAAALAGLLFYRYKKNR